ncbi:hypothetical protein DLM45_06105 [Hyphomicrobium methylovorum]|uniref:hypothetical protein n=1 Tax=Hyphomicrobium methylovorum TaxID=84 RepID=UPI0015E7855C|nr:hypothetical protein [Hyphomicrobium methylovorum]MBA2125798.1 hypothetical protein [Hyphomicrobium methylovorum]
MPPLMILALIGAAGIAGYKVYSSVVQQNALRRKRASEKRRASTRDLGSLEWDETAGVYRPRVSRDR